MKPLVCNPAMSLKQSTMKDVNLKIENDTSDEEADTGKIGNVQRSRCL